MTTQRNLILALLFVLGITSVLYADRPHHRGRRNNHPRGKNNPSLHYKAGRTPHRGRRPNRKVIVRPRPLRRHAVARRVRPRERVRVVVVRRPRPLRKLVRVVRVVPNAQPYREYNDRQVFSITILNRTGRKIDLELDGSHEGDDDIGKLYPGESMEYPMVVKSKELPETFELEAGPHEREFTLTHYSPRDLVFVVTRSGIYRE